MSAAPEAIGRYRILRELGRGMMGVVYLAKDPDLGRDIALKVIQLPPGASEADRTGFEQRFFSEAQSAARLTHPGIVIVHDVGRDTASGSLYMALQLLPGRTLESLLKEKQRLDCPEALRIASRIAQALQHAHSEGVVHRDIKPANIMILPNGDPKIMDFGIAKIEASRLTATGQFVGTPLYMSPEQAMAKPVDGRSDIFSLGSVLYEMLTGVPAFAGESVTKILFQLMSSDPDPPSKVVTSLPPAVDRILRRCLAKNVEQRYLDAQALARDLADVVGVRTAEGSLPGGPGGTMVAGAAEAPAPGAADEAHWSAMETRALTVPPRTHSRRALAVAAGLLLLGGFGWLIARLVEPPPVARRITDSTAPAVVAPEGPSEAPTKPPEVARSPAAAAPDPHEAAQLVIDFEHTLKSGVLSIFVDELMVVDRPFGGRVTRSIVGLDMRKGHLIETLEVVPGLHELRVRVAWDDNVKTERSQTFFNPGGRLRLRAKLGSMGGLRKDLSLEWN